MKQQVSHRLDSELLAWATEYGDSRGSSRAVVIEQALQVFRDLCRGGVADLPDDVPELPELGAAAVAKVAPKRVPGVRRGRDLVPDVGMSSEDVRRSRQAALNKRMGWS